MIGWFLWACVGTEPGVAETHRGVRIEGTVPAGVDLDELVASVPPGGMGVVADPASGEVAVLIDDAAPMARSASAAFSLASAARCPDCTGCTPGTMTRTIELDLTQDSGDNGVAHSVVTTTSTNYVGASTTPSTFPGSVGQALTIATTGTVSVCAPFAHYFDLETPPRVFTTSASYDGNLGGAAGADAICQGHADAAGLGGTWHAWISDYTTDARDRVGAGPWVQVGTGEVVAVDLADLTDGTIGTPLDVDEFGVVKVPASPSDPSAGSAWTGTSPDGTGDPFFDCASFFMDFGYVGFVGTWATPTAALPDQWTFSGGLPCSTALPLYCFEE